MHLRGQEPSSSSSTIVEVRKIFTVPFCCGIMLPMTQVRMFLRNILLQSSRRKRTEPSIPVMGDIQDQDSTEIQFKRIAIYRYGRQLTKRLINSIVLLRIIWQYRDCGRKGEDGDGGGRKRRFFLTVDSSGSTVSSTFRTYLIQYFGSEKTQTSFFNVEKQEPARFSHTHTHTHTHTHSYSWLALYCGRERTCFQELSFSSSSLSGYE
jgi:hypothetical protein